MSLMLKRKRWWCFITDKLFGVKLMMKYFTMKLVTGYWLLDAASDTLMHSLTIPRAVVVLAGGKYSHAPEDSAIILEVAAKIDDPDWSIAQSPFMRDHAKTVAYTHKISLEKDRLSYTETTTLDIYGRIFEHTNTNDLVRS